MALLNLEQAAEFCHFESAESFRVAAHKLGLPIIKMGKRLLFDETDLLNHLKKHHTINAEKVANKEEFNKCHSENVVTHGMLASPRQAESEYDNLLRLPTKQKRKSS